MSDPTKMPDADLVEWLRDEASRYRAIASEVERTTGRAASPTFNEKAMRLDEAARRLLERAEPEPDERPAPQPIDKCPRCGTPVYALGGFCGVCKGGAC